MRGAAPKPQTNKQNKNKSANKPVKVSRPKGAIHSKTHWRDRLEAWQAHHSTCAIESLLRLLRSPLQSLLTWLVVAIATALPATLFVALDNVRALGYNWQTSSQISVFINQQAAPAAVERWREALRSDSSIAHVEYISPEQALAEFREHSGLGQVLDDLEDNPLPAVLLVQPTDIASQGEPLEQLLQQLKDHALSDDAKLDMMWVQRLEQLLELAARGVFFLALLLIFGLLLVIGNTIRLAIESRRDEILVVKLVGGTDAYVRRPFLYTGLWYGLGGGLLALTLLALGLYWLDGPVARLASLYHSDFHLQGLSLIASAQLVLLAGLVGLAGAWLAVGRHLAAIRPQ